MELRIKRGDTLKLSFAFKVDGTNDPLNLAGSFACAHFVHIRTNDLIVSNYCIK